MTALQLWKVRLPVNIIEPISLIMATATYKTGISGKFGSSRGFSGGREGFAIEDLHEIYPPQDVIRIVYVICFW